MWIVLRKYQNEEYKTREQMQQCMLADGTETNVRIPNISENFDRHISTTSRTRVELTNRTIYLHETKDYAAPLDPKVFTAPFSRCVYLKISQNLCQESADMRRQAMNQLLGLYQAKPEHVVWSLKRPANMMDVLACTSLKDSCEDLRAQAAIALSFIMQQAEGHKHVLFYPVLQDNIMIQGQLLNHEREVSNSKEKKAPFPGNVLSVENINAVIPQTGKPLVPHVRAEGTTCFSYNMYYLEKFLAGLDDPNDDVKAEVLLLLASCHLLHTDYNCTKHLIRLGCIPKYVEKIKEYNGKHAGVCGNACYALKRALDVKQVFVTALATGAIPVLTDVLSSGKWDTYALTQAAECFMKLTIYHSGKRHAYRCESLKALLLHVDDEDVSFRTDIADAIASVTIYVPARVQALEWGIVNILSRALQTEDERDAIANHLYTVCNMADHPKAQEMLKEKVLGRVKEIVQLSEDYPQLHALAEKTISILEWKPGDPRI